VPDEIPELDAIGLACPLPVLRARKRLAAMQPGERLAVLASDPMAAIDIPHLCHQDGHVLLERSDGEANGHRILRFVVERGPNRVA